MRLRKYGHLDKNHKEIAHYLRLHGYSVGETSASAGFVDLVVSSEQTTCIAEIKMDEGKFYLSQLEYLARWKGNACFFTSPSQAVETMKTKKFLTPEQKDKILQFVIRQKNKSKAKNPQVEVSRFEKEVSL